MFSLEKKALEKISLMLDSKPELLSLLFGKLEVLSGQKQLPLKVLNQIESRVKIILKSYGVKNSSFEEVAETVDKKVEEIVKDFEKRLNFLEGVNWEKVIRFVLESRGYPKGFFLKEERAKDLILRSKPERLVAALGYKRIEDLIEKENIFEIFAALRFVEGGEWLNSKFLPLYKELGKNDFEEREVKIVPLSEKWQKFSLDFIRKKYHNVSHLKELGLIFILPRNDYDDFIFFMDFSLLFHYLREIEFFNQLLLYLMEKDKDWQFDYIKSISGIIPQEKPKDFSSPFFFIVSRYLEKLEGDYWQIGFPHLNSESLHWMEALEDIVKLGKERGVKNIELWKDSNWLAEFFSTREGDNKLLSFNFIDVFFSLAHQKEKTRYTYHFKEALWNYIFIAALGKEFLKDSLKENWLKAKIDL